MASTSSEGVYKCGMYASCCCAIKQIESEDINPILDRPVEFSQTGCRKQEGFATDFSSCWFPVVKALVVFVILCLRTWVSLSLYARKKSGGMPRLGWWCALGASVHARSQCSGSKGSQHVCSIGKWWQTMVFWSPKSQRKKQRLPSRKAFARLHGTRGMLAYCHTMPHPPHWSEP